MKAPLLPAATTMAAALASYWSVLWLEHAAGLRVDAVVLAVVLAVTLGRVLARADLLDRAVGFVLVSAVTVGASEVSRLMADQVFVGSTLFVSAVSATIWIRRWGPRFVVAGALATAPLLAVLVVPALPVGRTDVWWTAVVAAIAYAWAAVCPLPDRVKPERKVLSCAGGPPISTLPAGADSFGAVSGIREQVHPVNPSESPIGAPGGPPDSTLPGSADNSGAANGNRQPVHPANPSERSFRAPGGPPDSTLRGRADSFGAVSGNREQVHPVNPSESPTRAAGGPPESTLPAGADSFGAVSGIREQVHPVNPSESPIGAPGGPPESTLPAGSDISGRVLVRRRMSARMAAQMGVALGLAFVVGHLMFGEHWAWVVLTAFVVCSGNRGRGDVVRKGFLRVAGAVAGTAAATLLAGLFGPTDPWQVVAIFVLLAVGTWLRPLSYAYWAGCVTAALAFLYGYFGQTALRLLVDRLGGILVGGVIAIAVSWFVLPVRNPRDPVFRAWLARVCATVCRPTRRDPPRP